MVVTLSVELIDFEQGIIITRLKTEQSFAVGLHSLHLARYLSVAVFKATGEAVKITDSTGFTEEPATKHLSIKVGFIVFLAKFKAKFFHL